MGDNFRTFRLILMNCMKDAHQLEEPQTILLSLIDSKLFTIAHPIVQRGSNITDILDELQSIFSPEDVLSTKLSAFQNLKQAPGESIILFALRVTESGHAAHPALTTSQIQDYLVAQFITGLLDSNLKSILRLLGPQSLQQAITLVKRSQAPDSDVSVVNTLSADRATPDQACQLCNTVGHVVVNFKKFNVTQRKANPKGFQSTFSAPRQQNLIKQVHNAHHSMNLGHVMLILTHSICRGHAVIKILNGSQTLSQSAIPILPIMGKTRLS